MFCLSLFDIVGIQDFVFSSNKTKENVGASLLVSDILKESLQQAIDEIVPNPVCDWQTSPSFCMLSSDNGAEIIYAGGGNALVAFADRNLAIETTKALSRNLLKGTGGSLGIAVAHLETDGSNIHDDMLKLKKQIKARKYNLPFNHPLRCIAVTREGTTDGLPAVKHIDNDEEEWISQPAKLKRNAASNENDIFKDLLPDGYTFPTIFDDLGRDKDSGESLLAIVHVDGNNMGHRIQDYVYSDGTCLSSVIEKIKCFSQNIREAYRLAFADLSISLKNALKDEKFKKKFPYLEEDGKGKMLPLRPLIVDGDDITFVCDGRIGFGLTEKLLTLLYDKKGLDGKPFSACAGMVIMKPHFPFYRAYSLAEQLCRSAKAQAKDDSKCDKQATSWFDYHITYSGLPLDINAVRSASYSLTGKEDRYELLRRPYCVIPDLDFYDECNWSLAKRRLEALRSWPRSKMKGLGEALAHSKAEGERFLAECESRGWKLPENADLFSGDHTPWFDIVEMMDVCLNIPFPSTGGDE